MKPMTLLKMMEGNGSLNRIIQGIGVIIRVELRRFSNKEEMSIAAAALTRDMIVRKSAAGKVFTIALSGGNSPVRFYELLGKEKIDWSMVKIFPVDERYVPPDHRYSNFNMINKALLSKINIPEKNIYFFNTSIKTASECAASLEKRVTKSFGDCNPVFDLVVLGVGPDGHTASLFPGGPEFLKEHKLYKSVTAPENFDISDRLTMTLPFINRARNRIFIIAGKGKESIVNRVRNCDHSIPAGMVSSKSTIFYDTPV